MLQLKNIGFYLFAFLIQERFYSFGYDHKGYQYVMTRDNKKNLLLFNFFLARSF